MTAFAKFLKAQWLHLVLALGAVGYGVFVTLSTQTAWHWPALAVGLLTPITPWFIKDASSIVGGKVTSIVGTVTTVLLGMLAFYKTQSPSIAIPVAAAWLAQLKLVFGGGNASPPKALAVLLLGFVALNASGCAAVVASLPTVIADVQDAELGLGAIETIMNSIWAAHPNPAAEKIVDEALAKANLAADAVVKIAEGGQAVDQAQLDAAFKDFESAFGDVEALIGQYGVKVGDVPKAMRTASGGWVVPRPIICVKARRA